MSLPEPVQRFSLTIKPSAEPGNHGQNLDELVVVLLSEVSRLSLEVAALKRNRL